MFVNIFIFHFTIITVRYHWSRLIKSYTDTVIIFTAEKIIVRFFFSIANIIIKIIIVLPTSISLNFLLTIIQHVAISLELFTIPIIKVVRRNISSKKNFH